jgi:hypothetical protein
MNELFVSSRCAAQTRRKAQTIRFALQSIASAKGSWQRTKKSSWQRNKQVPPFQRTSLKENCSRVDSNSKVAVWHAVPIQLTPVIAAKKCTFHLLFSTFHLHFSCAHEKFTM